MCWWLRSIVVAMRRLFACAVLAFALAGCGEGSPAWTEEFRDQVRADLPSPEIAGDIFPICQVLEEDGGRDLVEAELAAAFNDPENEYNGSGRPVREILADYDIELTPAIADQVVKIFLEEIERLCP